MQRLSFTKVEKYCWNCKTARYEPFNGVENREEVSGGKKHPWPTRARKKTECPLPSTPQKHEKSCDETLAEVAEPWPPRTAVTETRRLPLLFVPSGVKLNFQRYIADILEFLAALGHEARPRSFLVPAAGLCALSRFQDLPVLNSSRTIPLFISKKLWPLRSPDLNPLDFSICSILKSGDQSLLLSPLNCRGS